MKKLLQPTKVIKLNCSICGEIMAKLYPWASLQIPSGTVFPPCKKCQDKKLAH